MAYKYLDQAGLRTVWDKIKQNFGLLDGISINGTLVEPTNKIANIPVFSNANTTSAGLVPPTASSSAIFLSGDGTWRTPPGTTSVATTATDGLMSASDKQTLDNIVTTGGEPNQNAFSYVAIGSSTVAADAKTDTLTLVGAGSVSLSAATGTDTITITGSTAVATSSENGLMSKGDKIDLDTIKEELDFLCIDGVAYNSVTRDDPFDLTHYSVCNTAADISNKTVAISGLRIDQGLNPIIAVKFTVKNTAAVSNLTLNANNTGAKAIKYRSADLPSADILDANSVFFFVYDGTYWQMIGNLDVTDSPAFTGTPTTPTPSSSSTATMIANKQYVDNSISTAISGVASFQGIASTATNPISSDYKKGYYWLVNGTGSTTGVTIVGQTCFDGDMIFAIENKTGSGSTADFTVVQQNISPMTDDDIATATPLT